MPRSALGVTVAPALLAAWYVVPGGAPLFGPVPLTSSTTFQTSRKMAMPTIPAAPTSIGLCFRVAMVLSPHGTNLNRRSVFPVGSALDETQHGYLRWWRTVRHHDRVCCDKGGYKQGRANAHDAQEKSLHGSRTRQARLCSARCTSRRNCRRSFIGWGHRER